MGFLSRPFTNHRTSGEGAGCFFNFSLAFLPASWILRYWPGDYCREVTSVHRCQSDSNQETLVSERKLLTTTLRALNSGNWISSCPNTWWPIQMFDFHTYSNCWITPTLLKPSYWYLFSYSAIHLWISFFLAFRKPADLKIGVWLSVECFGILYSRG